MITLTHQVVTQDHPPLWCESEQTALAEAQTRLPRPSSILLLRRHSRTQEESWEFYRAVTPE